VALGAAVGVGGSVALGVALGGMVALGVAVKSAARTKGR
jgi:hypothetical protein